MIETVVSQTEPGSKMRDPANEAEPEQRQGARSWTSRVISVLKYTNLFICLFIYLFSYFIWKTHDLPYSTYAACENSRPSPLPARVVTRAGAKKLLTGQYLFY